MTLEHLVTIGAHAGNARVSFAGTGRVSAGNRDRHFDRHPVDIRVFAGLADLAQDEEREERRPRRERPRREEREERDDREERRRRRR